MYIIHVGFGVRSFPPEHFKMTLILQKKQKKQQERRKQRRQNNKKANNVKKRIRLLLKN